MRYIRNLFFLLVILSSSASLYAQVPTQDSLALVALYNATGGPQWTNKTNWLQPGRKVSEWYGVAIPTNPPYYVTGVTLIANNLTGQLPAEIGTFTGLQNLTLALNHLSGAIPTSITELRDIQLISLDLNDYIGQIPALLFQIKDPPGIPGAPRQLSLTGNNFTSIDFQPAPNYNITSFYISNNLFDFTDIEPFVPRPASIGPLFSYSPQKPIYTTGDITLHPGSRITIKTQTGGAANQYQWKQNNVAITNATSTTYTTGLTLANNGTVYTASVTSTIVPNLTLERNPVTVHVVNGTFVDCAATTYALEAGTTDPQATFLWSTGATTRGITVNASGKYGVHIETPNYSADDTLEVFLPATLSLGPDINSCDPAVIVASNVPNADTYVWQTPNGTVQTPTVNATVNGEYTVTVTVGVCQKTDAVNVVVGNTTEGTFTVAAGSNPVDPAAIMLSGVPLTFTNTTGSGTNYTWSFGDLGTATGDNATHSYTRPGTYTITLTGTDARNCPVTAERTIVVQNIIIATAISANGDGKNDKWYVEPFLFKAELKVVDRKGRTVFEASPYNDDFTGQGLEEGVYYYDLYLSEIDKRYKGYIHILKH